MSLKARLRKLNSITTTTRPCRQCLVNKKAVEIFRDYLAARGVGVQDQGNRIPKRFVIRECPQCGALETRDISHFTEEEVVFWHSLNTEYAESIRRGYDFSPELGQKIRSSQEKDVMREKERYGEHFDGAMQAAVKYLKSFGFDVFSDTSEGETK